MDVGFDTGKLLVLRITPDAARYRTNAQTIDYYGRVLNSLREVPGIESVAADHRSADEHDRRRISLGRTGLSRPGPKARWCRRPAFGWRHLATSGRCAFR